MVDVATVWEQSLQLLSKREETKTAMAQAYLDYLFPLSADDEKFVFAVRLQAAKNWIEQRYQTFIRDAISVVLGSPHDIVIVLDETLDKQLPSRRSTLQASAPSSTGAGEDSTPVGSTASADFQGPSSAAPLTSQAHSAGEDLTSPGSAQPLPVNAAATLQATPGQSEIAPTGTGLSSVFSLDDGGQRSTVVEKNSRFTFDNYVMGDSNRLAYSTSLGVAEHPGILYNPLFIHGKSGLGKTHLLCAIKNYINKYSPGMNVVYAPTSEMVTDFTNAMTGGGSIDKFNNKYRHCDVLLLDDVQTLEGKVETSNALFEIFNMFTELNRQIVLSADRSPMEINLDERFTSRFSQGIKADIQPPNYEMKVAIVNNYKAYCCNNLNIPEVSFSSDALQEIVDLSGSNIRELEGAVINLIVDSQSRSGGDPSISKEDVSKEDVERILGSSFFHKNASRVDFNTVISTVEKYFSVSRDELFSEKRSQSISHPRQVAMYLLRRHTDMSYPEIGAGFNKDHSTAIYADNNIQSKMVKEEGVKVEVNRITEILIS